MSGIFGILRLDGGAAAQRALERLANAMAYRGPDGRDFVIGGPVGLGHCLMRVTGEDRFEVQPLEDRRAHLILVADCRLDNRAELAAALGLGPAEIREMPDSALILRAYKRWGEDCPAHLLGDFAFALWDGQAKKLVLARDHMGQRGLYFHRGENFFIFASDLQPLWTHPDVPRALGDTSIGLELTRPFHDKRVVELALAIPEELYVKNGRNRYLACMALRDLYPPEFQTRWRKNDDEIPDFQRMAKSIEPQVLADIARMEKSEVLTRYIDFSKIRRLLAARPTADDHNSGWEQETLLALGGYLMARYIEWFRRDNR